MVTPRTTNEVSQNEIQAFKKFFLDHDIFADGEIGEQNAAAIGDYLIDIWKVEITEDSLQIALEKLGDRIIYYSAPQSRYKRIASEDIARADQLNAWIQSPANHSLVKSGDENLENQTALLAELRGREMTDRTIFDAIGRASTKGLHFVPVERPADPRQHADTTPFAAKEDNRKYIGGKLTHEAGHIVAACSRGLEVEAEIIEAVTDIGRTSAMTYWYDGTCEDDLFVIFGGIEATRYFRLHGANSENDSPGTLKDFALIEEIAAELSDPDSAKQRARTDAEAFVNGNTDKILKMAHALYTSTNGTLSTEETRRIWDGVIDVVVPPEFLDLLDQISQFVWRLAA